MVDGQDAGGEQVSAGVGDPDAQASPAVFADGLHLRLDLVVQLDQKPGLLQQAAARVGQRQIGPALKKLDPIVLLQLPDLAAERLLGDKQAFRCLGNIQFFCGDDKILQLVEIHPCLLPLWVSWVSMLNIHEPF